MWLKLSSLRHRSKQAVVCFFTSTSTLGTGHVTPKCLPTRRESKQWASELAQLVKVPAMPRTHVGEGEDRLLKVVPWPPQVHCGTCVPARSHTQQISGGGVQEFTRHECAQLLLLFRIRNNANKHIPLKVTWRGKLGYVCAVRYYARTKRCKV